MLPTIDDWTLLSGGEVAIVRGHDYHVDIVRNEGTIVSGARLPFDFRKLTEADKLALIDSARKADSHALRVPGARATAPLSGADVPLAGRRPGLPHEVVQEYFLPEQMPDYNPAVRRGAIKGDNNNRAWILPSTSAQSLHGELVYDVVNNRGEFQFRVRLPQNRMLAGFGAGNVVYLGVRTAQGWVLERTILQN